MKDKLVFQPSRVCTKREAQGRGREEAGKLPTVGTRRVPRPQSEQVGSAEEWGTLSRERGYVP